MWVIFLVIVAAMVLFACALAKAAGRPVPQNTFKPLSERTAHWSAQIEREEDHVQTNFQGHCGCDPAGNSLVQNQDVAAQPGAPVGKVSEYWRGLVHLLALSFAVIVGVGYGWSACERAADHRYIRALAERHEAEARYWPDRLEETIQENKGRIARKEER